MEYGGAVPVHYHTGRGRPYAAALKCHAGRGNAWQKKKRKEAGTGADDRVAFGKPDQCAGNPG